MDKIIEKKKGLKKKHILWGIGALLFATLMAQIVLNSGETIYKTEKDKLTISTVTHGLFNDYITIIGQVEPISTIYLDAEEGGKVVEIFIEEGEMVKKGDIILQLKNTDLNTSIMNSESQLAYHANEMRNTQILMEQQLLTNKQQKLQYDLKVIQTQRHYTQYKQFFKDDLIARNDFLEAKENYELALKEQELAYQKMIQDSIFMSLQKEQMDVSLNNIQRSLQMAHERLDNLHVKAPVDGQLGLLDAEIGQSIKRGQSLGLVHVLTDYKINAQIDEHYIDRVKRKLNASFQRNNEHYGLSIKKVYPEVRNGQFKVDFIFKQQRPNNIRTGQTYHIKLELGQPTQSIIVPRGGFFQSTGGQWVFVLNKNETEAVKRNIKIGKQNPAYYEVLEGLKDGEKVITSSYELFGDNDKIDLQ
ncbi:efflux RND transporter periplasmic adaptor subunit [Saccharicrinis fermentans]|nr:efflux RND transporter periplasmic adaptor subunit [Saccharicrinis fermentans]